ncbi:squalene/phytoene synthase family protein [Acetobacter oeni]|uniref:Squalene synthase HpnC n=1 Tax=Acetobacter oeni TaxID=304077 RepID=A0A511XI66_9PROT|nr:squalene/phytoene synthase family protein [Acetobacter oeni]MBB3883061.1 squalene synthase HpnC [Acetobacter oeni]GBR11517.1 phytoene synthase [Acetobacter oeni LMG 21952]GEN62647.1 squalene synthase HpnC [Acetobacter oeni]
MLSSSSPAGLNEPASGALPAEPGGEARIDPWSAPDVSSGKGEADENFPVGSLLFRKNLRDHIHAYYDFARFSDDIADSELLTPDEKVARLDAMEKIVRGSAVAPDRKDARSAARLRLSLLRTGLSFEVATDLLVAFREDAVKSRYSTLNELNRYCRYSANPVGRFLLSLHGESAETFAASDALCTSLQILNHLQDCKGDLQRLDRCYMPVDLLAAHGLGTDVLLESRTASALRDVFDIMLDEVDRLNAQSVFLVQRVRMPGMRMYCGAVIRLAHLLAAHLRAGDPLAERVALTKMDFAQAALSAFRVWKN